MQRKTIPEKGADEEEDASANQSGELIACYNELASSEEEPPSYDGSPLPPKNRNSLASLRKSSKSSLSM